MTVCKREYLLAVEIMKRPKLNLRLFIARVYHLLNIVHYAIYQSLRKPDVSWGNIVVNDGTRGPATYNFA